MKIRDDRAFQLRWNIEYRVKKMQEQLHEILGMNESWNKWV